MKKNLIILTIALFSAFLLCGAASAATVNSTTSKAVSTAQVKDLIVTQVTAPTKGVKGHTITVSNTIKNQGNAATTGFYVNYYLKKSSSSTNIYIGKRYIASLGAGASNHQNTKLKLPTSIKSANYFIWAYADSTKLVKESIETNNAKYSTTKINVQSPKRDLIVTEVTARLWGLKGKTIIVANTIKNQENSATTGFWVNYYLKKSTYQLKHLHRTKIHSFTGCRGKQPPKHQTYRTNRYQKYQLLYKGICRQYKINKRNH